MGSYLNQPEVIWMRVLKSLGILNRFSMRFSARILARFCIRSLSRDFSRLFIADLGNACIRSVKLGYHAEQRVALKDAPDGKAK